MSKFLNLALQVAQRSFDNRTESRGRPPREKVPRTTQVKRAWRALGKPAPLKKWARESGVPLAVAWVEAK